MWKFGGCWLHGRMEWAWGDPGTGAGAGAPCVFDALCLFLRTDRPDAGSSEVAFALARPWSVWFFGCLRVVVWVGRKASQRPGVRCPRTPESLGAGVAGELGCLPGFHPANLLCSTCSGRRCQLFSGLVACPERVCNWRDFMTRPNRTKLDETMIRTGQGPGGTPRNSRQKRANNHGLHAGECRS